MGLTADQVRLLRCETARVIAAIGKETKATGGKVTLPDGSTVQAAPSVPSFTAFDRTTPTIDDALVDVVFEVGAYVQTMWEMSTLRAMNKPEYKVFNLSYDTLLDYLDDPSKVRLDQQGLVVAVLFAAVANLRGIADICNLPVVMPGVSPADPAIKPKSAPEDPPEPVQQKKRRRFIPNKKFGWFMLGSTAAAAVGLAATAVMVPPVYRRKDRSASQP